VRLALAEERPHSLPRVGKLAGRGHDLDGVGVGLGLIQVDLRVQRLLADALAVRRAAGDPVQQIVHGGVELRRGHHPVDQPPVQRGGCVDDVAGHSHFGRSLAADVPGHGHHRGVTEPAALPAGRGEAGLVAGHGQVGAGHQLASGRRGQAVHPRHHRLGHLLDQRHQLGAGHQQRADLGQVRVYHVGEVVPGAEHRSVTG